MYKRITLLFDLDKEDEKRAYDYLNNNGRGKSRIVKELILNDLDNTLSIDYDLLAEKIANKCQLTKKIEETDDKKVDKDFILNGISGFF